jgi:hypothetical protein
MTSFPLPTRCPVCAQGLHVQRVGCEACGSAVEGRFGMDWPGQLSREQLQFVKVFLLARGKIKDVEQALGLSYPTVVSRLDGVLEALGSSRRPSSVDRLDILDRLARGELDVDEAERRLSLSPPKESP